MKIIIPGLHNSDELHWQTLLEQNNPEQYLRIQQENWDQPDCNKWINRIESELKNKKHHELILIGHSIGCLAIIHWFHQFKHSIKGALLVAPSDAERENFPAYISGFAPIPKMKLPFPSIVVGSTNDHVTSTERTKELASQWGSKLVLLKDAGHIETKSGFGEWPQCDELLAELSSGHEYIE